jgi:hypothetical protein
MGAANASLDALQVVRGNLVANTTLVAEIGDRVYGAHLEDADAQGATYPLVILEQTGGDLRRFGRLQDIALSIWAYSRTSAAQAQDVYRLASQVLETERLTLENVTQVVVAQETERPVVSWNEKTRAHFARGRWRLQCIG